MQIILLVREYLELYEYVVRVKKLPKANSKQQQIFLMANNKHFSTHLDKALQKMKKNTLYFTCFKDKALACLLCILTSELCTG